MVNLAEEICIPPREEDLPLTRKLIDALHAQTPDWDIVEEDGESRLWRRFTFPDFASAVTFVDSVAAAAEYQNHHPLITLAWGEVTVAWWTHTIGGLHRNDFIMACRTTRIYEDDFGDGMRHADRVQVASEGSFPASDAPGWRG